MDRKFVLVALLLLPFAWCSPADASPVVWATPAITSDTTWSGEILLRQPVTVSAGATLRVLPGTKVLVEPGKGIGITVLGRMVAGEKGKSPLEFLPSAPGGGKEQWEGIALHGGKTAGHVFSGVRIGGAREGIALTETAARIEDGVFSACGTALRGNQRSSVSVDNCTFDGNGDGVFLSLGGDGIFRECRFVNIRGNGIVADKGAVLRVASSSFSRGKTGIFSLTNSPCRIEGSAFLSLEKGIVARQMGKDSTVARCSFENDDTGILAGQNCSVEVADSVFLGNRTGMDVQEFSAPTIRKNRFERNQVAVNVFRKSRPPIEGNVFFHNRNAVVVNYSSYPRISGNDFERNDMSVRLEKFQSRDWEERAGSRQITGSEVARRGPRSPGMDKELDRYAFPKRIDARGNYWGPDPDRDPAKGTMGKIWDGRRFGPVRYEGSGDEQYRIDEVDFSEESPTPIPGAGPGAVAEGKKEAR